MVKSDQVGVTVGGVPGECPYPLEGPVFTRYLLKCEAWEISDSATKVLRDVDTSKLLGGTLTYAMEYTQGNEIEVDAHIYFNDQRLFSARWLTHGAPFMSGTLDLTGLIDRTNAIKIAIESLPITWCEVAFDIWITLCFSEEPDETPEIVEEGKTEALKWVAIGCGAVALAALLSKGGPPVVIVKE